MMSTGPNTGLLAGLSRWLAGHIGLPLRDVYRRQPVSRYTRQLLASQYQSQPRFPLAALQQVLAFARQNVPHYANYPHFHTQADWADISILTKSAVRDNPQALRSHVPVYFWKKTSGSTGQPLSIAVDREALAWQHAATRRAFLWTRGTIGQVLASAWGPALPQRRLDRWLEPKISLDTLHWDDAQLAGFLTRWNQTPHACLFGHPHSLAKLAEWICSTGAYARPANSGIITAAVPLLPSQRSRIEAVFGQPVFDRYGCEEVSLIASQCEAGSYHLAAENVYVEIIEGEIVVTDLRNRAMPLIRYALGDRAEWGKEVCPCGRRLPTLSRIEGRTADFLNFSHGQGTSGVSLTEHFLARLPELRQMQIIQTGRDAVRLRVQLVDGREELEQSIRQLAKTIFPSFVRIELEWLTQFPLSANGKFRYCQAYAGEPAEYLRGAA